MLWYEKLVLALIIDFVFSIWDNKILYKIRLNQIGFWLVVHGLLRPRQYWMCTWFVYFIVTILKNKRFTLNASFRKMVWIYVFYFHSHIDLCCEVWSEHLVLCLLVLECQFNVWHLPLTAFSQITLYIQIHLTCVLIREICPCVNHRLCLFNMRQQEFVLACVWIRSDSDV